MNKRLLITLMLAVALVWGGMDLRGQTTISNTTFETAGGYSTSVPEFTDNGTDYFTRTDGSNISGESFSNLQGTYYFAAQDTDGDGQPTNLTLIINDINISGYTSLQFKVYIAEDDAGDGNQDWDSDTWVHFLYDIDNTGTFSNLLWVEAEGGTNTVPKIDTDFDGLGDGTEITSTFVQYSVNIGSTGSLIDFKVEFNNLKNGDEDIAIDNIEILGITGGNAPPSITNISHSPVLPNSTQTVSVSADITDSDGTIAGAELHWGTVSGNLSNSIDMSVSSGNTYTSDSDIPAQASGATIYYEIYALDDEAGETTSPEQSYQVLTDEPSAYVTSFMATANSATEITLSWTDADASGYLIKGSTSSLGSIVAPVDGTPEADDALVQNVASGTQTHQFTSLTPATTYNFKIYPYNGTDGTINYKTDGSVPEATAATEEAPAAPNVFISEYLEGSSNNKAIEIVNATSGTIDLSDYAVKLASNGGDWGNSIVLSGSLDQGKVYVIGNASAVTTIKDRFDVTSTVTYFNGDDALGLFYQDVLIDAIGVQGVDPGSSWDVAGVSGGTVDHTLVRKLSVTTGNTNWAASAGTNATDSEWIVLDQDHFYNLGVFGSGWTGLTDNAWETIANWDVQIPDAAVNILINAFANNMPTISSSAYCNNLTIESSATSSGSLLGQSYLTVSGTTTIERYATAGTWHGISGPLDNDDFNSLYFGGSPNVWAQTYLEASNTYDPVTSLSTDLGDAKGWMVWIGG
ncbi:MAG: lamin tail domain-containing protein, partial [Bacteroidales bacterium]|nr:lamin tail domain-containing protein [Bacteroidales bacterium]